MFTIESVLNVGNDLLQVTATDQDGQPVTACGWVSATENYYPASSYDSDGNLLEGATPRAMTPEEVGSYVQQLLAEQNPEMVPSVTSVPVMFS